MRILFSCPTMEKLAARICDGGVGLGEIVWNKFNDGWPDAMIKDVERLRGADAYFLASFREPGDVFAQYGVMCALARYGASSLTVLLPYFPVGTMERVDVLGQLATAKTLARLLSSIPSTHGAGLPRLVTYDIHALGEQFYFDDRVQVEMRSAVPMFIRRLKKLGEPVAICFPDEGAEKRFGRAFREKDFPVIVCSKVRDGTNRVVTVKEGETIGVHAVIVDDLIQSGGTIHECRTALLARGAAKVSVFATHPVMPQMAFKKFKADEYAHVWVTDSVPETTQYLNNPPFEVLSLAHEIRADIFRVGQR